MNQLFKLGEFEETEETNEKDLDIIENLLNKYPEILTISNQEKEPQNATC